MNKQMKQKWMKKQREEQKHGSMGESKRPIFPYVEIINIFENRMKLGLNKDKWMKIRWCLHPWKCGFDAEGRDLGTLAVHGERLDLMIL